MEHEHDSSATDEVYEGADMHKMDAVPDYTKCRNISYSLGMLPKVTVNDKPFEDVTHNRMHVDE